jgi:hypothetical protein
MPYDRDKAVQYASTYWDRVCHDGRVVATKDDNSIKIEKYDAGESFNNINISGENDCTHFISCCIGFGGGLPITVTDFFGVYGIVSANKLVKYLIAQELVTEVTVQAKKKDAEEKISQLEKGDIIAIYDNKRYAHLTLHLGNGLIAAHTSSRYKNKFTIYTADGFTFLHIKS